MWILQTLQSSLQHFESEHFRRARVNKPSSIRIDLIIKSQNMIVDGPRSDNVFEIASIF